MNVEEYANGVMERCKREVDRGELIKRLKKSKAKKIRKETERLRKRDGIAFVCDKNEKIDLYMINGHDYGIGIGMWEKSIREGECSIMVATCFCSPADYKKGGWSDRIARGLIGYRLKNGFSMLFKYGKERVHPFVVVLDAYKVIVNRGVEKSGAVPRFVHRICENDIPEKIPIFSRISTGRKGQKKE